jgi:hypothetical protein
MLVRCVQDYTPQAGSTPLVIEVAFVGCPEADCSGALVTPQGFISE